MKPSFSHLDARGDARMVDVSDKPEQHRRAVAVGSLVCARRTIRALKARALPKGDVLAVARVAGIQAAKRTSELIPLCHSLPLHQVTVDFTVKTDRIEIRGEAVTEGRTGVEMEALTAVSVAALTLYDMMKAVDKAMRMRSFATVPTAILSRATAGVRGRSLILNLPGNPRSIGECLPPLIPAIREALRHLHGET